MKLFCKLLFALFVWQVSAGASDDAAVADGRGNYAAVLKITRPLALKGEAWAETSLGDSYRAGDGVASNDAEAVKWYRLVASQGNADAQLHLGSKHDNGQGVLQGQSKAIKREIL